MTTNDTVTTPNAPAVLFQAWLNPDDPAGDYIIVRHPKPGKGGDDFDPTLAVYVFSRSNKSGWLAAYRQEDVK